jgi:hypothetical protein
MQSTLQEDFHMKPAFRSGASIAAAAAALILAGAVAMPAAHAAEAKGHCVGANACKGKGFLSLTKVDCDKIEGATFEPAEG